MAADELFLQGPPRFDRVEVGRVRRQVHHFDARRGAKFADAGIVMGAEVVHHELTRIKSTEHWG
jgi:hypothetical protein